MTVSLDLEKLVKWALILVVIIVLIIILRGIWPMVNDFFNISSSCIGGPC